jgi:hypothetical protein
MSIGNDRKIRPNRTIQKIPPDRPNHRRDADNIYSMPFFSKNEIVSKKRNTQQMVKMGMSNENMFYLQLTFDIKNIGQTSRIK